MGKESTFAQLPQGAKKTMTSRKKYPITQFVMAAILIWCATIPAISAQVSHVYVSELFSGKIIGVDMSGNKQPLSTIFNRPGPITFDKQGSLYVYDYDKLGVYKISRKGNLSWYSSAPPTTASISRSVVDITTTKSGKILLNAGCVS